MTRLEFGKTAAVKCEHSRNAKQLSDPAPDIGEHKTQSAINFDQKYVDAITIAYERENYIEKSTDSRAPTRDRRHAVAIGTKVTRQQLCLSCAITSRRLGWHVAHEEQLWPCFYTHFFVELLVAA